MSDPLKKQQLYRMAQTLLAYGDRLSDEDLKQIQSTIDALERAKAAAADGHHDHDHPSILARPGMQNELPG